MSSTNITTRNYAIQYQDEKGRLKLFVEVVGPQNYLVRIEIVKTGRIVTRCQETTIQSAFESCLEEKDRLSKKYGEFDILTGWFDEVFWHDRAVNG